MTEGTHLFEVFAKLGFELETWPLLDHDQAYVIKFIARRIYECRDRDGRETVEYQDAEASSSPSPTPDRAKAEWHVQGSVKWDGCCDYKYNQETVMLHICGPADVEIESELLRVIYRVAHKAMPETAEYGFSPPEAKA